MLKSYQGLRMDIMVSCIDVMKACRQHEVSVEMTSCHEGKRMSVTHLLFGDYVAWSFAERWWGTGYVQKQDLTKEIDAISKGQGSHHVQRTTSHLDGLESLLNGKAGRSRAER